MLEERSVSPEYQTPVGMQRKEFRAMGTTVTLLLPEGQAEGGKEIAQTLFEVWERTLSRFLPESELSHLNSVHEQPVEVSGLLYMVLATALTMAQETEGVYDPALLDQLVQLGYDQTFDKLPHRSLDLVIPGEPGGRWRGIKLDPIHREVTLPANLQLDFGGIAKGMAVDAALEALRMFGIASAMVNAGGDLAVLGHPPMLAHWPISVPGRSEFWVVPLLRGAIATSGIARRHWWQGQTFRHHLLDPLTGLPAESDLYSVTVTTDLCEQAEVAAKVAFILGSVKGRAFLQSQGIAGLLIHTNGTWETVEPCNSHVMEEL